MESNTDMMDQNMDVGGASWLMCVDYAEQCYTLKSYIRSMLNKSKCKLKLLNLKLSSITTL